jgi:hypothetical protein
LQRRHTSGELRCFSSLLLDFYTPTFSGNAGSKQAGSLAHWSKTAIKSSYRELSGAKQSIRAQNTLDHAGLFESEKESNAAELCLTTTGRD